MRELLAGFVLLTVLPASAAAEERQCFTPESRVRAEAAMTDVLRWPTTEPPLIAGSLVLACEGQDDASIACEATQVTESRYPIAEAALAYAAQLRLCTPHRRRFQLPLSFVNN